MESLGAVWESRVAWDTLGGRFFSPFLIERFFLPRSFCGIPGGLIHRFSFCTGGYLYEYGTVCLTRPWCDFLSTYLLASSASALHLREWYI